MKSAISVDAKTPPSPFQIQRRLSLTRTIRTGATSRTLTWSLAGTTRYAVLRHWALRLVHALLPAQNLPSLWLVSKVEAAYLSHMILLADGIQGKLLSMGSRLFCLRSFTQKNCHVQQLHNTLEWNQSRMSLVYNSECYLLTVALKCHIHAQVMGLFSLRFVNMILRCILAVTANCLCQ